MIPPGEVLLGLKLLIMGREVMDAAVFTHYSHSAPPPLFFPKRLSCFRGPRESRTCWFSRWTSAVRRPGASIQLM